MVVFDKAPYGRDKVCGDGLTPRRVGALEGFKIDMTDAHPSAGCVMIAGKQVREWTARPPPDRFPDRGAGVAAAVDSTWPLIDAAVSSRGPTSIWEAEACR